MQQSDRHPSLFFLIAPKTVAPSAAIPLSMLLAPVARAHAHDEKQVHAQGLVDAGERREEGSDVDASRFSASFQEVHSAGSYIDGTV